VNEKYTLSRITRS